MRYFIKGEALCFAFLFSASVFAQAPVSDINQTSVANNGALNSTLPVSSLEERVAVLERIIKSRNVMQQNLQTQLDDMQYEVDELRGTVELHTNQLEKVLQRQRELYLEIDKRVEALRSSTQLQVPTTTPDPRESRVPSQPKLGESES